MTPYLFPLVTTKRKDVLMNPIEFLRRWQFLIGSCIILAGLCIHGCQTKPIRFVNRPGGGVLDRYTGKVFDD